MIRILQKSVGRSIANKSLRCSLRSEAAAVHEILYAENRFQNPLRSYQTSPAVQQPKDEVHVSIETSKASGIQSQSGKKDSKCGPIEDDEMEQEEMFVVADPILGLGEIQEWGGPRRGGRLEEPTRFGDWERKGRCTDF